MSDESTISSSAPSNNSTGTLEQEAASNAKAETATEGESDYAELESIHPAYSMESITATALTASNPMPGGTTAITPGPDIENTQIRTLAELHQRLSEVPPEQLVVLYFQSDANLACKVMGPALGGLRNTFNLEVIKLDLQDHQEITKAYNIIQAPTFVLIKNSEKLEQFSGGDIKKLQSVIGPLLKKM